MRSAETILRERVEREKYLPGLTEAQWIMLLDLLAAHAYGNRLSVSDLCVGSYIPQATAIRRIDQLAEMGMVERVPDDEDRRRVWVCLTVPALELLDRFVERSRELAA